MKSPLERALDVWVWVWLCILALLVLSANAKAQWHDKSALERALYARMVVWKTPKGKLVTIRHCGDSAACQERVRLFSGWITQAAQKHHISPWLLGAVALHESGLNPMAEGSVGERGIFQLHPRGAGRTIAFIKNDAYRNLCARRAGACQEDVISSAARLLSKSIKVCQTTREALGYYNSGRCSDGAYSRRILAQQRRLMALSPSFAAAEPAPYRYCQADQISYVRPYPWRCATPL